MKQIKVFLADDHQLVRQGFAQLLADYPDLLIVGQASDGAAAIEGINAMQPDLAIIDVSMPGFTGIEVVKQSRETDVNIRFLIISMYDTDEFLYQAFKAGADGYLSKECSKSELFNAVFEIAHGRYAFGSKTYEDMIALVTEKEQNTNGSDLDYEKIIITGREKIIIKKLMEGKSTKEMSDELFISENTVTTHRRNILHKFHCASSFELVSLFNSNLTLNLRLNQK